MSRCSRPAHAEEVERCMGFAAALPPLDPESTRRRSRGLIVLRPILTAELLSVNPFTPKSMKRYRVTSSNPLPLVSGPQIIKTRKGMNSVKEKTIETM